jgi:hypothetical protein
MIKTEQKILTWSRHNIDYIGTQLKTYLFRLLYKLCLNNIK